MTLYDKEPAGLEGINAFYDKEFLPILKRVQKRRGIALIASRRNLAKTILIFTGCVGAAVVLASLLPNTNMIAVVLFGVAAAVFCSQSFMGAEQETFDLKPLIVGNIASFLGLRYSEAGHPGLVWTHRALDLLPDFDHFDCEDGFTCTEAGLRFRLTEARLKKHMNNDRELSVFSGVLVTIDVAKEFSADTIILRKRPNVFDLLPDGFEDKHRVKLEDPKFSDVFAVYSSDQVEARYLLTPATMTRLLDLAQRHKDLVAGFADGALHLAFAEGNCFEFDNDAPHLDDPALVRLIVEELLGLRRFAAELSHTASVRV